MTRPLVESGLRLEVDRVAKTIPHDGAWRRWRWTRGDEPAGWINLAIACDGTGGPTLELSYTCDGTPFRQSYRLEAEPCRFGGLRWFVRCPKSSRRVSKLYSLAGAGFHSRHAYGAIAYACQRDAHECDRALRRRDRILFQKLKGDDPLFTPKPKWMRRRTYERLMARLEAAEDVCDRHMASLRAYL